MPETIVAPHIWTDDQGRAWIDDANFKVIEIALDHIAYGWTAEAIQENHPSLTLAQVYAALGWYYDHQDDLDAEIEGQSERLQELRASAKPSPLARRAQLRRAS
jgi:uncharacterized protein (DUF433 family)